MKKIIILNPIYINICVYIYIQWDLANQEICVDFKFFPISLVLGILVFPPLMEVLKPILDFEMPNFCSVFKKVEPGLYNSFKALIFKSKVKSDLFLDIFDKVRYIKMQVQRLE